MKTFWAAIAALCVFGFIAAISTVRADDMNQSTKITGILIDQACAKGMMTKDDPEKAAESHPKSCATKDACAASGYGVISGKEFITFDDNGNKLAKDFLAKTDKTDNLRVTVEGTRDGDKIAVTSLNDASDSK